MPTRINIQYNVEQFFGRTNLNDLKKEAEERRIPFEIYAYMKLDDLMSQHRERKAKKEKEKLLEGEDCDLSGLTHDQKLELITMRKEQNNRHFTEGTGLSTRAVNLLKDNFDTLDELSSYVLNNGTGSLKKIKGMGKKTAIEIIEYLRRETAIEI